MNQGNYILEKSKEIQKKAKLKIHSLLGEYIIYQAIVNVALLLSLLIGFLESSDTNYFFIYIIALKPPDLVGWLSLIGLAFNIFPIFILALRWHSKLNELTAEIQDRKMTLQQLGFQDSSKEKDAKIDQARRDLEVYSDQLESSCLTIRRHKENNPV